MKNFNYRNKILSRLSLYRLKLSKLSLNKLYFELSSQIDLIFSKFSISYNRSNKNFLLLFLQLECIRSIQSGRILFLKENKVSFFSNFWKFNSFNFSSYQILRLFLFYIFTFCFYDTKLSGSLAKSCIIFDIF